MLELISTYPTLVWTVLLGVSLVYWVFVIIGALGFDGFDGVDIDGVDLSALESTLLALGIGRVPFMVWISIFSVGGWTASALMASLFSGPYSAHLIALASLFVGVLLSRLVVPSLEPVFATAEAQKQDDLRGSMAVIRTSEVRGHFGQAYLEDNPDLIIEILCEGQRLRRGDRVLLIEYFADTHSWSVELMESADTELDAHTEKRPSTSQPTEDEASPVQSHTHRKDIS